MYEDIPHLLTPVVVDPKQAANALRWAVREMEERYKTLAAEGVRNIEQYNRNVHAGDRREADAERRAAAAPAPLHRRRDRRAGRPDDGRQQRGRAVDRAAGADGARRRHPPDSRDAAAVGGCHHRSDQGEHAGAHFVPRLVEGRLADDPRRQRRRAAAGPRRHALPAAGLVALHPAAWPVHLRAGERRGSPAFCASRASRSTTRPITAEEKTAADGIEMEKDDLYDEAARIVVQSGQASISYLQRRLRIGFSRAARLVDMMEMEGLVSPAAGGKAREVLVDKGISRKWTRSCDEPKPFVVLARVRARALSRPGRLRLRLPTRCTPTRSRRRDASAGSWPSDSRLRRRCRRRGTSSRSTRALVRQYPASGYSDDALWQAGVLALDAFERFGQEREDARERPSRLLKALVASYPTSSLVRWRVPRPAARKPASGMAAFDSPRTSRQTDRDDPGHPTCRSALTSSASPSSWTPRCAFHDERIAGPERVFRRSCRPRAPRRPVDRTLRFDSDAEPSGRSVSAGIRTTPPASCSMPPARGYSVYPLYNPYRLVIDCVSAAQRGGRSVALTAGELRPLRARPARQRTPESRLAGPIAAVAVGGRSTKRVKSLDVLAVRTTSGSLRRGASPAAARRRCPPRPPSASAQLRRSSH